MPEHLDKRLVNFASILHDNTREQAILSAQMPFIHPHIALMPDAHLGKGATVGSVIPTDRAIIPAAVGVDIGCGMDAIRTQYTLADITHKPLSFLREAIEWRIPLSPGNYNATLVSNATQNRVATLERAAEESGVDLSHSPNWRLQLGSLGGGNHFIEVSIDEQEQVWLFLHSGSRGVGNKIAQKHIKIASQVAEQYWISLPHPDLAYLVQGTREFSSYIEEMIWAQKFAHANRAEMMQRVVEALSVHMDGDPVETRAMISCHHNYTSRERHFGKDVWLSRKGAIDASEGTWGLIPGSMGAASYVVVGKGNPLSLNSAPHGAGREHSRSQARKMFSREDLRTAMAALGIEWRDSEAFVDEHPGAYKDIDQVMADAADLVEVKHTLRQVVNVKGE